MGSHGRGSLRARVEGRFGRDGFWAAGSGVCPAAGLTGVRGGQRSGARRCRSRSAGGAELAAAGAAGSAPRSERSAAARKGLRGAGPAEGGGCRGLPGIGAKFGAGRPRAALRGGSAPAATKPCRESCFIAGFSLSPALPPLPSPSPAPFPSSPRSLNGIPAGRAAGRHHRASRGAEPRRLWQVPAVPPRTHTLSPARKAGKK